MIKEEIKKTIEKAVSTLELEVTSFIVEHPDDIAHGDYSTNIALVLAKSEKENPRAIAEKISNEINANLPNEIERIEVAGAGFINFYLSKEFFTKSVSEILKAGENFGKNDRLKGLKMLYEYTDPNPFKQFHIGHLMSNTIGESL